MSRGQEMGEQEGLEPRGGWMGLPHLGGSLEGVSEFFSSVSLFPDCGLQSPVSPAWGAECRNSGWVTLHSVLPGAPRPALARDCGGGRGGGSQ